MMVSPGCGSFPEANWMIFWDVWRNWDTPVHGLWPLGPLSITEYTVWKSHRYFPTSHTLWDFNNILSYDMYLPKVVCVLLVIWVILQKLLQWNKLDQHQKNCPYTNTEMLNSPCCCGEIWSWEAYDQPGQWWRHPVCVYIPGNVLHA